MSAQLSRAERPPMIRYILLTPKISKISGGHSLACFGEGHPCARWHGHTWWVQATFGGNPDPRGILIDYEVVKDVVNAEFDHYNLDEVFAPQIASGENILLRLVERFTERCKRQGPHVELVRVTLSEDPIPGDAHTLVWCAPTNNRTHMTNRHDQTIKQPLLAQLAAAGRLEASSLVDRLPAGAGAGVAAAFAHQAELEQELGDLGRELGRAHTARELATWAPFWFEGNEAWGLIETPSEWNRIRLAYSRPNCQHVDLNAARRGPDKPGELPNFGLRGEHQGSETLADYFNAHGMGLLVEPLVDESEGDHD